MDAAKLGGPASVSVVIAAKNAAATIGTAISSALQEPEVGSVIVVDDGSTDQTAEAARRADDGTARVRVLCYPTSSGPSFARNRGIEASNEPFIAILDADDFFFPGRFAHLFKQPGWDLIADNIAFFSMPTEPSLAKKDIERFEPQPSALDLTSFVRGNIGRRGLERTELGFLKPLIKREFLDRHGIRYDETLRLGEDYDLYTRALVLKARFKMIRSCGYGAVVRASSLSGKHSTADLHRLADVNISLLERAGLTLQERTAIQAHEGAIRNRYRLRFYLESRHRDGLAKTLGKLAADPQSWRPVVFGILADKIQSAAIPSKTPAARRPRYLFPAK